MSKKFMVALLAAALCLAFLAPAALAEESLFQQARKATFAKLGPVPKVTKPIRIGAVVATLSNPFWVAMKNGYLSQAKELGVKVDVQAPPQENSMTAQLNILETMVGKGYNVICAHTITASNLIPGLVKAAEKGIPVLTDKRVDMKAAKEAGAKAQYFGLVNFFEQGQVAAQFIVANLAKKGGGKVAIIEGLPGAPQSRARKAGAESVFKKAKGFKLVAVQPADWDRNKAYTVATNLIQAHPDLKGLMCCNDIMALAAIEAFKSAGKGGKVMVTGIDLIPQAKDAIAKGELAASVAFSPWVIGELMTRAAVVAAMGKKVPDNISVTSVLAKKSNVHLLKDWK